MANTSIASKQAVKEQEEDNLPSLATSEQDEDFLQSLTPVEIKDLTDQLEQYVKIHRVSLRPICLVTSGGTVVDLEVNAVRSLENFSTGLRGAIAVEELLRRGYAVVHLWRQGSASPFARVLSQLIGLQQSNYGLNVESLGKLFAVEGEDSDDDIVQTVLDQDNNDPWMTSSSNSHNVDRAETQNVPLRKNADVALNRKICQSTAIQNALESRTEMLKGGCLLTIPFRTVEEYLAKLQICCECLSSSKSLAMIFLAAAVSDFYIPMADKTEHKIQSKSNEHGMILRLKPVPKLLGRIRQSWAPDAFVVSFKLETDKDILRSKAERSVALHDCHLVIGNLLHSRHEQVWILSPPDFQCQSPPAPKDWEMIEIKKIRDSSSDSLESLIVDYVMQAHFEFISFRYVEDGAGIAAMQSEHEQRQEEKKKLQQVLFWSKTKSVALEIVGAALTLWISYSINSTLQRRWKE